MTPTYKTVDTCAAEFAAETPYYYSTWEDEDEVPPGRRPRVLILGSGPNRIGQGIEFDYCCVHACFALGDAGFDTVMVNCNPETVSTDYDTSDRLVLRAAHRRGRGQRHRRRAAQRRPGRRGRRPRRPDTAQAGRRSRRRAGAGHVAGGHRRRRGPPALVGPVRPPRDPPAGRGDGGHPGRGPRHHPRVGFPVLVRPSYVLGGRAMQIVYDDEGLRTAMDELAARARWAGRAGCRPSGPVLIDRFLEDATEVDVDALRDHTGEVLIGGIMEHVEEAGVHSGDSACVLPPVTLSAETLECCGATPGPSPRPWRSWGSSTSSTR